MPDTLPSWRPGATKQHIVDFVNAVTTEGGPHFVKPAERVATFDVDGTLWTEQPMYAQFQFAIDLVKRKIDGTRSRMVSTTVSAPLQFAIDLVKRQFRRTKSGTITSDASAVNSIVSHLQTLKEGSANIHHSLATVANLIRVHVSVDEYISSVQKWLLSPESRHPCFERPYTDLTYQPMRELLDYLRTKGFRTYIVSGSGIEFLRAFSEKVFDIPPEQVIGTSLETEFKLLTDGKAELDLVPWPDFIDNGKRKAESINQFIGRRPIAAFGNSDGDLAMFQWTAAGNGARLMVLVHHTDGDREYSYDRCAHIGHLDLALDEARKDKNSWEPERGWGWLIADMARDWDTIYSFGGVTRNNSSARQPR